MTTQPNAGGGRAPAARRALDQAETGGAAVGAAFEKSVDALSWSKRQAIFDIALGALMLAASVYAWTRGQAGDDLICPLMAWGSGVMLVLGAAKLKERRLARIILRMSF